METTAALAAPEQAIAARPPPVTRTVKERVGAFELRLTYEGGRLVEVQHHDMTLHLAPEQPSGVRRGSDGWEIWRDGTAFGSWANPSDRNTVVNESVGYERWLEGCLRDIRRQVFYCCGGEGQQPTAAVAAQALDYAIEHELLSPGCSNAAAESTTRIAAHGASEAQRRHWRRYFHERGLGSYVEAVEST
jgi:hypothetical protein